MKTTSLISSAIMIWALSQTAYGQTFNSSDKQVSLIELYTSEGCSSCPPADKWLNSLKGEQGLWTDFIPLAFHVDYWDYIGWKDPFADPSYTQRQYRYNEHKNIRSIYTPGVVVNGQEWRLWRRSTLPTVDTRGAGQLNVNINQNQLSAQYQADIPRNQTLVLNIALLGFDLTSKVKKGENVGRTFEHDFVVIGYRTIAMQPNSQGFIADAVTFPTTSIASQRTAIATWVNTPSNPTPLQATGGWLN
jgi:hypothetical protein